jgi:hypothetical protein
VESKIQRLALKPGGRENLPPSGRLALAAGAHAVKRI